ncbi:hypothetical protein RhiJN_03704 [Ceratobasidium sp. AG-Ba]|nr:hypothetical protein RhiJN_03704 [Ceratobasidium sp. AG-Ba]
MSLLAALASPGSESGSLVSEDGISSDGISSPDEHVPHPPVAPLPSSMPFDGAKGVASAGLDLHSPQPAFVGTPFASGPTPLFEYPFPATPAIRPSLSNASSLSSVHGPPSPTTRLKQHPLARLSSKNSLNQPVRRRLSGGNNPPPIRVPPRLRTDSSSSVASSVADEPTLTAVSAPDPSDNSPSPHPSPLVRLRDRSGSLGVLPIPLPPPLITSVPSIGQSKDSVRPRLTPALVVGPMAASGLGLAAAMPVRSPLRRTISEGDDSDGEERPSFEWRRASVPALFGFREELDDALDEEVETPTSGRSHGHRKDDVPESVL